MTTTTNTNGRVRMSLASQIDRLDSILDGLAEAINETVVAAVQEAVGRAVREAVQATLAEVLTNPQLRPLLQPVSPTEARPPAPVLRPVQREVRLGRARRVVAPVREELLSEALLVHSLEEARRDDLVRVHVVHEQRHHPRPQPIKRHARPRATYARP